MIEYNECKETFDMGKDFGRALAMCEDYTERLTQLDERRLREAALEGKHPGWVPNVEDLLRSHEQSKRGQKQTVTDAEMEGATEVEESAWQPALDWLLGRDELGKHETVLNGLIASPLVKRSVYAGQLLTECSLPVINWSSLPPGKGWLGAQLQRHSAIENANRVRGMLWLAFGELLGLLRDVDSLAQLGEWAFPAVRPLKELFDPSGDNVRNAIREAKEVLNTDASEYSRAKAVVLLASCIQPLVKRTWPNDQSSRSGKSRSHPWMDMCWYKLKFRDSG